MGLNINDLEVVDATFTRELTKPTVFWDLSLYSGLNNYNAKNKLVGTSWLYTNYYFKPNSDGKIFWETIVDITAYVDIRIGVLDMSANTISYYTYTIEPGVVNTFNSYFYNLDPSKNYAVCWMSVHTGFNIIHFSGTAEIGHKYI